jgi:ABC-type uncharacterized transport system auxiliary subunit
MKNKLPVFATAKRDTFINRMDNMDVETPISQGTWMFLITSDKQTRYLESDEICVYTPELGLNYSYKGDWELGDVI